MTLPGPTPPAEETDPTEEPEAPAEAPPAEEDSAEVQVPAAITQDADGNDMVVDANGNKIEGADPASTVIAPEPEVVADIPPAAAVTPAPPADILLPTDGNHSPETQAAAEALGIATAAGAPLSSFDLAVLRDLRKGITAIDDWRDWLDKKLAQVENRQA